MIVTADHQLAATPAELRTVEAELLEPSQAAAVAWAGRATTALVWAYRLAARRRPDVAEPEVLLPASTCVSAAHAALLAGVRARFVDADPESGLAGLPHCRQRVTSNTVAVLSVHHLGQAAEVQALAGWCRQRNLLLIEDVAQALGGCFPGGSPLGSRGDVAVFSFNRTKILECGGGALAVRDPELAAELRPVIEESGVVSARREPRPPALETPRGALLAELGRSYRNLHHALVALLRMEVQEPAQIAPLFEQLRPGYAKLYLRPLQTAAALASEWPRLPDILERRRERAERYAERLAGGPWHLLDRWRESGVCWRFSLLVDDPAGLVEFSERVRSDGFHVSNLYWPANHFFAPGDHCPHAESIARRIVNLWVDDAVNLEWIDACCRSLWKHASLIDGRGGRT